MRTKFLFFAILIQILITLSSLIYSQYVLKSGQSVSLKVEFVDPRDLLRGNFVRLNYILPEPDCQIDGNKLFNVYAIIKDNKITQISCIKPKDGLYIRGKGRGWFYDHYKTKEKKYQFFANFGIDAFFTTPENAKMIEKNIRENGENIVNLRILNGKAVVESLQSNGKIYGN